MKYFLLVFTTIISLSALAQPEDTIIKDAKPLEVLFKDTRKHITSHNIKYVKNVTIQGLINKALVVSNHTKTKHVVWVLILADNTKVWIETKFNLNKLYKKRMQMNGDIIEEDIDIYSIDARLCEPKEKRYRIVAMKVKPLK